MMKCKLYSHLQSGTGETRPTFLLPPSYFLLFILPFTLRQIRLMITASAWVRSASLRSFISL